MTDDLDPWVRITYLPHLLVLTKMGAEIRRDTKLDNPVSAVQFWARESDVRAAGVMNEIVPHKEAAKFMLGRRDGWKRGS